MNITRNPTTLILVVASLMAGVPVHAQSISFGAAGEIFRPTCSFTVEDVNLGEHDLGIFTAVDTFGPWRNLDVTSTGCSASTTSVHMTWTAVADASNARYFAMTGTLSGVGVHIVRQPTTNTILPNSRQTYAPLASGQRYEHRVRLIQTLPTVTTGTGTTPITLEITYN